MVPVEPILTAGLFRPLHRRLVALLRGLPAQAWSKPTVCPGWTVHDIAAHMLDTQIRRLSVQRDGHWLTPDRAIDGPAALAGWLNGLNAEWVRAARRISPRQLTAMLAVTGGALAALFESLDPAEQAIFPVSWAGEEESANWFDTGRDYTEYWHHQQQIRDAVGAPPLYEPRFLAPVLALFLRALPYGYQMVAADEGTAVEIRISGRAGGVWTLRRESAGWALYDGADGAAVVRIQLEQGDAWRLFCKGLTAEEGRRRARIDGETRLSERFFTTLAIVA